MSDGQTDEQEGQEQGTVEEFELEEPSTESVGRSPVTGQTADDSQEAPGQ